MFAKIFTFPFKVEELSSLIRFDGFVCLFDWLRRVLFMIGNSLYILSKENVRPFLRNVYFTSVIKRLLSKIEMIT